VQARTFLHLVEKSDSYEMNDPFDRSIPTPTLTLSSVKSLSAPCKTF
jgi:hypothetical protein